MIFLFLDSIITHHVVFSVEFLAGILLLFIVRWIYELYMELYTFIYWNFSVVYKDSFTIHKIQQWINI